MLRKTTEDIVVDIVVYIVMIGVLIATLYPVIYQIALSFSSANAVARNQVWLWPVGFNFDNYKLVLKHEYIPKSFMNSVFYTVVGTAYSMFLTILGAYALSRKKYFGRDFFMFLIAFTMLFGGGLIPTFLLVKGLGLYGSRWALIIPAAVSQYNLIVMRTSMQQIPDSIEESAKIDGANDFIILFKIMLPMSVPVLVTISLFYAVGKWNDFFGGLVYLKDKTKYPLQLVARELLIAMTDQTLNRATIAGAGSSNTAELEALRNITPASFRAAVVIVVIFPLLIVYPFLQKYFIKGVMIGAIKG